jgi:diadenosine tetraphosphate (Ap4A) HIT family hydrolase
MENCIFCKIAKKEISSQIIYEDKDFIATLDINPNVEGMTLVMPKKHYGSDIFEIEDDFYKKYMVATKKVVKILEKGLKVKRVAMVAEGMGINHAHIKLYPLHGLSEKFVETWAKEKVFFDKYPGYITTLLGPRVDNNKLKEVADKITKESR